MNPAQDTARRDRAIDRAVATHKIGESRRRHYERAWAKAPEATEKLLARLASVGPGILDRRSDPDLARILASFPGQAKAPGPPEEPAVARLVRGFGVHG